MRSFLFAPTKENTNRRANKLTNAAAARAARRTGCRLFCRERINQIKTRRTKGSTQFYL